MLEPLGEGGMGQVFLCEHLRLHKLVAVKLLNSSWVSVPRCRGAVPPRGAGRRGRRTPEHHPRVRRGPRRRHAAHGHGVRGRKSLHQIVAEHAPLSPARAAEYVRQTAVGLHAAHKAGLVHRDIKPGNLLLDRTGVVKVLDLGLARFMVDSARNNNLTQKFDPGTVLGTLDFIAPEQADDSSGVDIRADIYSLGYTLYYLLAGKLAFGDGSAAQKLIWHQMRHPEPLSVVRPGVPPALHAVFARMTAKAPARPLPDAGGGGRGAAAVHHRAGAAAGRRRDAEDCAGGVPTRAVADPDAGSPRVGRARAAHAAGVGRRHRPAPAPPEPRRRVRQRRPPRRNSHGAEGGAKCNSRRRPGTTAAQTVPRPRRRLAWPVAGLFAVLAVVGLVVWPLAGPRDRAADRPRRHAQPAPARLRSRSRRRASFWPARGRRSWTR